MNQYLRAFVIGSSYPVFVLYFNAVSKYDESKMKYTYRDYTMFAPFALGILNAFGLYFANIYSLSRADRFFLTGLIGSLITAIFITVFKIYDFESTERWFQQYFYLIITYIFVFCVIVNTLDMYV
jgi:hypothetical protein